MRVSAALVGLLLLLPASQAPVGPWPVTFTDIAKPAGLTHPTIYGDPDRKRFIIETNGAGVALIDVDRDGWLDALVLSGTRLEEGQRRDAAFAASDAPTTRLYRNRRDGTFEEATDRAGLRRTAWSSSVCAGDYDNDGSVDLFMTAYGRNVLYRNRGDARFEDVTSGAGLASTMTRWGAGCTFIDIDRDGRLDLFVANYLAFDLASAPEPGAGANCQWRGLAVNCGPKGLPADTNLLYRNQGDGTFADVSARSGIARVTGRYSMTAVAADLTGDDWTDIYVAADSTASTLYRNNRDGTFTDIAIESGTAFSEHGSPQAGMGVGVGDYNRDGLLDMIKTHFADDIPALYRNLGRGLFEDAAVAAGLNVQNRYVQWGTALADFDNDGWPDAFSVTGHVYPELEKTFPQYPHRGPRVLFRNVGGRFEDVSNASGPALTVARSSRGAAVGDIDNDGDQDVLIMNMNEAPTLLRNDYRGGNAWIDIALEGGASGRTAFGATVIVTSGGRRQARALLSQSSYYSHEDARLHFGLGSATRVESIEVRWPSGRVERLTNLEPNRVHRITER